MTGMFEDYMAEHGREVALIVDLISCDELVAPHEVYRALEENYHIDGGIIGDHK